MSFNLLFVEDMHSSTKFEFQIIILQDVVMFWESSLIKFGKSLQSSMDQ